MVIACAMGDAALALLGLTVSIIGVVGGVGILGGMIRQWLRSRA